jgi:hypothetical protein
MSDNDFPQSFEDSSVRAGDDNRDGAFKYATAASTFLAIHYL